VPLKKYLGQNFLKKDIAREVSKCIIEQLSSPLLEIGPGHGALTMFLTPFITQLSVIELDKNCIDLLREKWPTLQIIQGDASLFRLPYKYACGNLPFRTSIGIIENLRRNGLQKGLFIIQYDLYLKFNQSSNNRLKIYLDNYFVIKKHRIIKGVNFYPTVKVDGILLEFKTKQPVLSNIKTIRELFKYCRKSLGTLVINYPLDNTISRKRPGDLSIADYAIFFKDLQDQNLKYPRERIYPDKSNKKES